MHYEGAMQIRRATSGAWPNLDYRDWEPTCTALHLRTQFLQSTYEAAAEHAGWNRAELECPIGVPRVPRLVSD